MKLEPAILLEFGMMTWLIPPDLMALASAVSSIRLILSAPYTRKTRPLSNSSDAS
ncbi:hypothetical protein D3C73_1577480 [compost metagenome]